MEPDPLLGPSLDFGQPLPDLVDGPRVLEGRGVADLLAGHQGPDHASHDLPAPRLRELLRNVDVVRDRDGSDRLPHVFLQLLLEGVRPRLPFLEDDISDEGLPFDRMRLPDDRGLRDLAMAHEGGLHLHRTDPVARDVDHVVDAAHEPEVVVLVHAGPVPVKYLPGTWDQYTCLYRSGSLYRVWSMAGQGFLITR